jgi:hypothetical protein
MERPEAATVVLPAYGVVDAIATVIRDLAVAASALRPRGVHLDVLVLAGDDDVAVARGKRRLSASGRKFSDEHFGAGQDLERLGTRSFDRILPHPPLGENVILIAVKR